MRPHDLGRTVRMALTGAAVALACAAPAGAAGRWYAYEDCRLLPSEFHDGDSFHVQTRSRHHIFRLYFVDAPETDLRVPERVAEQSAYWGIAEDDVLRLGDAAKRFAETFLEKGFTARSRLEPAMGRSDRTRYYALIEVGKQRLCEELVRNGLARVHGTGADLPDGSTERDCWTRLRAAESEARRKALGAWGVKRATAPARRPGRPPSAPHAGDGPRPQGVAR